MPKKRPLEEILKVNNEGDNNNLITFKKLIELGDNVSNLDEKIKYFKIAEELMPDRHEAPLIIACLYIKEFKREEAIPYLEKAIKNIPETDEKILFLTALVFINNDNLNGAQDYIKEVVDINPENNIAKAYLGLCIFNENRWFYSDNENVKEPFKYLKEALNAEPENRHIHEIMCEFYRLWSDNKSESIDSYAEDREFADDNEYFKFTDDLSDESRELYKKSNYHKEKAGKSITHAYNLMNELAEKIKSETLKTMNSSI